MSDTIIICIVLCVSLLPIISLIVYEIYTDSDHYHKKVSARIHKELEDMFIPRFQSCVKEAEKIVQERKEAVRNNVIPFRKKK